MDISTLKTTYDKGFVPSAEYLASMPDLQNTLVDATKPIERVGIHNFHLPLKIRNRDGGYQECMVGITGTVGLDADKAGINMSRILRTMYRYEHEDFTINKVREILRAYKKDLETFSAHILFNFQFRYWQESLRSTDKDGNKNGGWQYYNVTFDVSLDEQDHFESHIIMDFVYSSACPCSTELAKHAASTRDVYGIPHSQRSVARISMHMDEVPWIEDIIDECRKTLTTETLVFCKREDEQAFGELNGAQPKFVEDAVRLLEEMVINIFKPNDYKIVCSHLESLHSHDAIAVVIKGVPGGYTSMVTFDEYQSLRK